VRSQSWLSQGLKNQTFYFIQNNYSISTFQQKHFSYFHLLTVWNSCQIQALKVYKLIEGDGLIYIRTLFLIFFIDACLTDDEPIWEPVE
jgi:hypothetical protein